MKPFNPFLKKKYGSLLLIVFIFIVFCFSTSSFSMVAPDPEPEPEPVPVVETAPVDNTPTDQIISQVETPAPSSPGSAAEPDSGSSVEAPAFEAPASSEDLIAQFEF